METREIKFRAWDKEEKKIFNNLICPQNTTINKYFKDEKFEFMQFTGLHDKNEKEIYEGDVIKWRGPGGDIDGETLIVEIPGVYDSIYRSSNWEIIGNIYSNPELPPTE